MATASASSNRGGINIGIAVQCTVIDVTGKQQSLAKVSSSGCSNGMGNIYSFQQHSATASEVVMAFETVQESMTATVTANLEIKQHSTGMMQCTNINHVIH